MKAVVEAFFKSQRFFYYYRQAIPLSDFQRLPKIELHLHLDSSLSYEAVKKIRTDISRSQFRKRFVAPPKCKNLPDYLQRVANQVALLQTESSLEIAAQTLAQQLVDDHVIYAEIRFAPLLHTRQELRAENVLETVCNTLDDTLSASQLKSRIIVCSLRDFTESQSMQTVQLARKFKQRGVVGFDLAGDERGFPLDNHIKAYRFAREHGISITAHAGEAVGPESVWEALIKLKPSRIGHGVRSCEDPKLLDHIQEQDIHLEVCPTSNIQTNVYETYADHTVNRLYRKDISLSINTDGRTTSDISLSEEYAKLQHTFGWTREQLLNCNLNALSAAFIPEEDKQELKSIIEAGY